MYEDIIGLVFFLVAPLIIWVTWAYMVESPAKREFRISQSNKIRRRKP